MIISEQRKKCIKHKHPPVKNMIKTVVCRHKYVKALAKSLQQHLKYLRLR